MKGLDSFTIDLKQCLVELKEFEKLLLNNRELKENKDILPFFKQRLHLSAFIGSYVPNIVRFNHIKHEFTFFGDFRADLAVGDSVNNTYCFIEFEDAMEDSIFVNKGRSTLDWSPRFEHGFSQIIDWFWKLDDEKNTSSARAIFGTENIEFYGILVIGRDTFISPIDKARLKWRLNKVLVDSRKVICITFDQLAKDTRDRLSLYPQIL
ncbi:DUF4263 domain-containing protein [Sphaerospermopsis aphanizomenoides BCCUSP55]|uniref:Shedu immune nuclease family protein n=1 Tax=Sphaerospermopsis aphanizomenoides TaxID=459663 RepID=UPI001905EDCC|nr:Shedu immune nuclease family protein [Sphaerospermopsis aphanizomenoides]MBK1987877.1 DUF4263 domain-containing protein [Sphaerospermopsis aphanizomenoides BCCUSP55]